MAEEVLAATGDQESRLPGNQTPVENPIEAIWSSPSFRETSGRRIRASCRKHAAEISYAIVQSLSPEPPTAHE